MPPLTRRVEILEERVDELSRLPGRIEQIAGDLAALRVDVRAEFGAVRNELAATGDGLRAELTAMRDGLRAELATVRDELRSEIRAGDGETRREMRVLHEDVISRIALLQEGMNRQTNRPRRSRDTNKRST